MKYCLLILLFCVAAGCARTVYVPEMHTEYRDRVRRDSVFVRDSVVVFAAGDTVYIYRDRWRDRTILQRDTVVIRDSVPYPVVVEKPVRHVPRAWRWGLWLAVAAVGWCAYRLFGR